MHCPAAGLNLIQPDGGSTAQGFRAGGVILPNFAQGWLKSSHPAPKSPTPVYRAVVAAGFSAPMASLHHL